MRSFGVIDGRRLMTRYVTCSCDFRQQRRVRHRSIGGGRDQLWHFCDVLLNPFRQRVQHSSYPSDSAADEQEAHPALEAVRYQHQQQHERAEDEAESAETPVNHLLQISYSMLLYRRTHPREKLIDLLPVLRRAGLVEQAREEEPRAADDHGSEDCGG